MNQPTTLITPIRKQQRPRKKDTSTSLEIGIAVLAYVGLLTLIMSVPLSTFSVWG